jgi:hypothetical protein
VKQKDLFGERYKGSSGRAIGVSATPSRTGAKAACGRGRAWSDLAKAGDRVQQDTRAPGAENQAAAKAATTRQTWPAP